MADKPFLIHWKRFLFFFFAFFWSQGSWDPPNSPSFLFLPLPPRQHLATKHPEASQKQASDSIVSCEF